MLNCSLAVMTKQTQIRLVFAVRCPFFFVLSFSIFSFRASFNQNVRNESILKTLSSRDYFIIKWWKSNCYFHMAKIDKFRQCTKFIFSKQQIIKNYIRVSRRVHTLDHTVEISRVCRRISGYTLLEIPLWHIWNKGLVWKYLDMYCKQGRQSSIGTEFKIYQINDLSFQ